MPRQKPTAEPKPPKSEPKRTSRPDRWYGAIKDAQAALAEVEAPLGKLKAAFDDLASAQEEYNEWLSNLPESLQQGGTAEKLEAIGALEIDGACDIDLSELADVLDECENAELPSGFERDW